MRTVLLILFLGSSIIANAQALLPINEVKASVLFGHYSRAQKQLKLMRFQLKVTELANAENYKQARFLQDSVRAYERIQEDLDNTNAGSSKADERVDGLIKNLEESIAAKTIIKSCVIIDELGYALKVKAAKEASDFEKIGALEAALKAYKESTKEFANNKEVSISVNKTRIEVLKKALSTDAIQANEDSADVYLHELELREKVQASVELGRFISAQMDDRPLRAFLADPKPRAKPVEQEAFVPTTANQKRIVELQKLMVSDRKAGKYINLWPMTQEINYRNEIEKAVKKGDEEEVKRLEKLIAEIVFQ